MAQAWNRLADEADRKGRTTNLAVSSRLLRAEIPGPDRPLLPRCDRDRRNTPAHTAIIKSPFGRKFGQEPVSARSVDLRLAVPTPQAPRDCRIKDVAVQQRLRPFLES